MEKQNTSIIQKLGVSYECALAIGNSLDLAEMFHEVIHTIVHKTNAHRGIIWFRGEKEKDFRPIASAGIRIKDVLVQKGISSLNKRFKQILKRQQFVLVNKDEKDFLRYCTILTGKEESVLIIPIKNIAMIHLIYASREIVNKGLVNLLSALSQKLSVAIDACLAHKRVVEEICVREKAEEQLKKKTEQFISSQKEIKRLFAESEESRKALLSILEDATETQNALQKSEKRFRDVAVNTGDWIWETDEKGRYTYCSPVVKQVLGYEYNEVLGKYFYDFFHPDEREELKKAAFEVFKKKEAFKNFINQNVHKNGHTVILETSGIPMLDDKGNLVGYRGVDRDITERRKMEEEVLKAQKLESLGFLAGGIAHDFNNILTAILGNISLVKMYVKPEEEVFEILTEAEKASLRAKDLTQQLLIFSRGGEPIKKTTSIGRMIKDSTSLALTGSNVRCKFSIAEGLWLVNIDEGQISQVISNLIINANQAMPEGGTIEVKAENIIVGKEQILPLQDGKYIKISIKDQGIGIPKEHLPKIFDPYFTTKQKGSGLGLASTYSIIKKHDGYITVESGVGVGTTFHIYLPASEEKITISERETEELTKGEGKILLMDDEDIVLKVGGRLLKHLGYEVEFARDGTEAIALYKKAKESGQPFYAVILDLIVPGSMGGKEAIKKLIKVDSEVKAIVSSGYSNDPVMADYRKYGFSEVITKPYKIEELGQVLYRVIKESKYK